MAELDEILSAIGEVGKKVEDLGARVTALEEVATEPDEVKEDVRIGRAQVQVRTGRAEVLLVVNALKPNLHLAVDNKIFEKIISIFPRKLRLRESLERRFIVHLLHEPRLILDLRFVKLDRNM